MSDMIFVDCFSNSLFTLHGDGTTSGDIKDWLRSGLLPEQVEDVRLLMDQAAEEIERLRRELAQVRSLRVVRHE